MREESGALFCAFIHSCMQASIHQLLFVLPLDRVEPP